ncbi:MAG: hypothetical protein RR877_00150 [Aurantimicrobium sp.]|uniref:hypothetical protein n=1 Tax=Aurantimicrobium sp. TaxID=1930784 RepID=UPI002FC74DCB
MADIQVKWYHSMMRGIPIMNGQVGRLITYLDAVLVNGFGQTTVTTANVVDGILTLNITNSETFQKYTVVNITGDDQLKGDHRVIESANTYIKIALNIPNQTFTGTFYVKYASLGWSKLTMAAQPNMALYVPKSSYSGFNLAVNDTYGSAAFVRICRGATNPANFADFNTLIDSVPIYTSATDRSYWAKNYTNNTATTANFLIGDGSTIYYQWGQTNGTNGYDNLRTGKMVGCGDIIRYMEEDTLSAFLVCGMIAASSLPSLSSSSIRQSMQVMSTLNSWNDGAGHSTFLGNVRGEKGNDTAFRTPDGPFFGSWSGYGTNWVDWAVNGTGLELNKLLACSERVVRGEYPGIYTLPFDFGGVDDMLIEEGSGDMAGRLIMFKCMSSGNTSYDNSSPSGATSVMAFDITGPWR